MSRLQILLVTFVSALLLSVGAGAGAWYYMYGGPEIAAAQLVPANTLAFATIPNGAAIFESYQTSQAKQLAISPNMKPLHDEIIQLLGPKNADLIHTFLPNLSGQSFIAITQFDIDHPDNVGFIAGMKPKAGLGDFGAFLDKLKADYGDELKDAKTGKGTVAGHDYDWIQAPGVPQKVCVANINGWIITAFGEASLQDWIERYEKHSTTSSLADNGDYRASVARVGESPEALVYFNYHTVLDILQKQMVKTDPKMADYFAKKFKDIGGLAAGTSFENGQVVDRYSFIMPRQAQLDAGMSADPCPFDTLKFTSRDTRLYTATAFNWKQYYANLKEQMDAEAGMAGGAAPTKMVDDYLKSFLHETGIDVQHNIIEALGGEVSLQVEWNDGMNFPEVGFFAKVAKPDDFKPVISAILTAVRKQFATTAVIKEMSVAGQNFATLNFQPVGVISPTITEDGPYFGMFLTANQAARSFQRDPALTLAANDTFKQQIGDQRNGAQQIVYFDSPFMLNRAYKLGVPYLSMAAMFNTDVAKFMRDHPLPDDLAWLAPMGSWSCVFKNDATGVQGYSISGVGNQGIFLTFLGGAGLGAAQSYGLLDKAAALSGMGASPTGAPPAPSPGAAAAGVDDSTQTNAAPGAATAPTPAPDASSTPAPAPPPPPAPPTTPPNATPSAPSTNP